MIAGTWGRIEPVSGSETPVAAPRFLGIGGAHVDRRGASSGAFVPGASNPGTMREDVGGGVFNALRTAARLGAAGSLFSVRGGDQAGTAVSRAVEAAGLADLSVTYLDRMTPSYTALLDDRGDLVGALADMGLYDFAFPRQVRRASLRQALDANEAVLVDANLPEAALRPLLALAGAKPVFAIAVSPAKVMRLVGLFAELACLFMNRREAAALTGLDATAALPDLVSALRHGGLVSGVITAGDAPVTAFAHDETFAIQPPSPPFVRDVTGAGDALAGAACVGLATGLGLLQSVRQGMAAAFLAVQSAAAAPGFSPAEIDAAQRLVPVHQPL